ncbi:TetR/AcrR family transcriptional regulator [Christensenella tenuis]|uniref:TetR/AcrR family transcriptional regulator n=1 Tax=Christensenella tenuis TaxID=2763033 RepID=A0ABR7EES6_9FIRM|nr:TetR/AcrR family transcriptional regulator [Christensenella tenuis]MBC5647614.1 TetR/AcrR family transcriptional regulator [Christensenella tenuis]
MTRHGELNKTREILLNTALVMIKEDGLEAFSARKLAEKCGLTHQAPYRYFENKENLMEGIITEVLVQLGSYLAVMLRKRRQEEPFLVIFEETIRFLVKNPSYGLLLYSDVGEGLPDKYAEERRRRISLDFRKVAKDYFTRCGILEEKQEDVFDAVNAILNGLILRMMNRAIILEGSLGPFVRIIVEDILHLKIEEE